MATAPFSLYVDAAAPSLIVKSGTTVTVTTKAPHCLSTGAFAQMDFDASTALGSAVVGAYQVTVTSGTVFTYTASGTTGGRWAQTIREMP